MNHVKQHESREYKGGLNENVRKSKQKSNHNESWCECKELEDWIPCRNDYMWNSSTCDCEWPFEIDEYLDKKMLMRKTETSLDD